MKSIPFVIACFAILSTCCLSCDKATNNSNRHQYKNTHDYEPPDSTDKPNIFEEGISSSNRWIWQKPELVIERLGDLKGKRVADIGAGPYGYFSFRIAAQTDVEKVIAIDIDKDVIEVMEEARSLLAPDKKERLETRLVEPDDPKLKDGEVDIVLMVNLSFYINDRVTYFKNLRKGIAENGKLVIIDFKKRSTPIGPAISERVSLGQIEAELQNAGYNHITSDDRTLDYQYIITAMAH